LCANEGHFIGASENGGEDQLEETRQQERGRRTVVEVGEAALGAAPDDEEETGEDGDALEVGREVSEEGEQDSGAGEDSMTGEKGQSDVRKEAHMDGTHTNNSTYNERG
jgi:hypothetical protein